MKLHDINKENTKNKQERNKPTKSYDEVWKWYLEK